MIRVANLSTAARYFQWKFKKPPFNFETWITEEEWVHDTDVCGSNTSFWVVIENDKTTYYEVGHSWWVENYADFCVENTFDIAETDKGGVGEKYAKANLRFVV